MQNAATADMNELIKALEEKLEFSTVTGTRQGFLPMIERLHSNPAHRFVITKHGNPQAVLMSYATYEALKKFIRLVMQSWDSMSESQQRESALERFRAEQASAPVHAAVAAGEPTAKAALQDLQAKLESAQAAARVLEQKVAG